MRLRYWTHGDLGTTTAFVGVHQVDHSAHLHAPRTLVATCQVASVLCVLLFSSTDGRSPTSPPHGQKLSDFTWLRWAK